MSNQTLPQSVALPNAPKTSTRAPYQKPTLKVIGQLSTLLRGSAGSRPDGATGKKSGPGPA